MDWLNRCHFGDVRAVLRAMIADGVKVQTIVTSPPYWGLRDYGHPGQIGLEATPELYVATMVDVFGLAMQVLADDGTLWLNLGDSYAANRGSGASGIGAKQATNVGANLGKLRVPAGLKEKDLVGIPWMTAFALRASGWYLRQGLIWQKPNPMPESVKDRCTKSHEDIFLMSKSPTYYFDHEAIQEPCVSSLADLSHAKVTGRGEQAASAAFLGSPQRDKSGGFPTSKRNSFARTTKDSAGEHGQKPQFREDREDISYDDTRNKRSVWTVATKPYSGAHFATFPTELIEPCILAGAPVGGIVLDPFFGSGTTGQVAQALGRQFIGIELNPEYKALQDARLSQPSLALEAA